MTKNNPLEYKPFPAEVRFHQNLAKVKAQFPDKKIIAPQPGPQTRFCLTPASMVLFGGAAGGGKSFALAYRQTPYIELPQFSGGIFRRTFGELKGGSGMWRECQRVYGEYKNAEGKGAVPNKSELVFNFPSGAQVSLNHCQHESDIEKYRSSAFGEIGIDEATTFSENIVMGLWQRNRDTSGMIPALAMGTNPDPDSFLREMIDWWIDDEGYAIESRSGIIRYFMRHPHDDTLQWRDTAAELTQWYKDNFPRETLIPDPVSFTFIPSKLKDNPAMNIADPGYGSRIAAQPKVWRERMGAGNWDIRAAAGDFFKREWVGKELKELPTDMHLLSDYRFAWGWDLAATKKRPGNDPDYTAGVLLAKSPDNHFYIMDCVSVREDPRGVIKTILECARKYPQYNAAISIPIDAGAGGVFMANDLTRALAGFNIHSSREEGKNKTGQASAKEGRFYPFSAQGANGNVSVVHSGKPNDWEIDKYFMQLEEFPNGKHDDLVDATSRAFIYLTSGGEGVIGKTGLWD